MSVELPGNLALELQMLGQALLEKGVVIYNEGYVAGVASVPAGGGFSQEQVDQMIVDALAVKEVEVKAKLDSIKEALKSIDASEDAAVDALFV